MPKVSFIVPVYNAEKLLGHCINSILRQSFRDIELILVNDGSSDNSLIICRNYAELDKRVRVFDIPNGGPGYARNFGIEKAVGEYIQFVDADDEIAQQMTANMIGAAEVYEKDLVMCSFVTLDIGSENQSISTMGLVDANETRVYTYDNLMRNFLPLMLETSMFESPVNKLYKRDIIISNDIRFPGDITYGEDLIFNMRYMRLSNGAVFLAQPYYYYKRWCNDTLSTKPRPEMLKVLVRLEKEILSHVETHHKPDDEEMNYFYSHFISRLWFGLKHCCSNSSGIYNKNVLMAVTDMLNEKLVQEAFRLKDHYIPCYKELKDNVLKCNVTGVLELARKNLDCECSSNAGRLYLNDPANWGRAKRLCLKGLNGVKRIFKNNPKVSKKVDTANQLIIENGVKNTARWVLKGKI